MSGDGGRVARGAEQHGSGWTDGSDLLWSGPTWLYLYSVLIFSFWKNWFRRALAFSRVQFPCRLAFRSTSSDSRVCRQEVRSVGGMRTYSQEEERQADSYCLGLLLISSGVVLLDVGSSLPLGSSCSCSCSSSSPRCVCSSSRVTQSGKSKNWDAAAGHFL